jgi:hypothetical protein
MFDYTGQYLLIRMLFKRVADGDIKVKLEPQVLAWLIDLYRQSLTSNARVFRDELTYFYMDISKVNYREVELCFQYFIAIALLFKLHANIGFDRVLLKAAKEKVLDPINDQVSDFRSLQQLEERPKFDHLDLLLYTLSDTSRVINKSLYGE